MTCLNKNTNNRTSLFDLYEKNWLYRYYDFQLNSDLARTIDQLFDFYMIMPSKLFRWNRPMLIEALFNEEDLL